MAKKNVLILFFLVVSVAVLPGYPVNAEIDSTVLQEANLQAEPLDVAPSDDGNYIYVLVPGQILVYSRPEGKITDRIPVDKGFDRIEYSGVDDSLVLTGRSSKLLNVLQVEIVRSFDVTGLAFRGPEKAPVLVAVFSDYQ